MISIFDQWAKNFYEGREPVSFVESQYHLHLAWNGLRRRIRVTVLRAYQGARKNIQEAW